MLGNQILPDWPLGCRSMLEATILNKSSFVIQQDLPVHGCGHARTSGQKEVVKGRELVAENCRDVSASIGPADVITTIDGIDKSIEYTDAVRCSVSIAVGKTW